MENNARDHSPSTDTSSKPSGSGDTEQQYSTDGSHPSSASELSSDSRGDGARFIVGFATAGLLLAGVVGVWTLQSTNESAQSHQDSAPDQTQISELSDSSSTQSQRPTTTTRPSSSSHAGHNHSNPNGSNSGSSNNSQNNDYLMSMGEDPYLPPNSWDGQQSESVVPPRSGSNGYPSYSTPTQAPSAPATSPSQSAGGNESTTPDDSSDTAETTDPITPSPSQVMPSETTTDLPGVTETMEPTGTTKPSATNKPKPSGTTADRELNGVPIGGSGQTRATDTTN